MADLSFPLCKVFKDFFLTFKVRIPTVVDRALETISKDNNRVLALRQGNSSNRHHVGLNLASKAYWMDFVVCHNFKVKG